MAKFSQVSVTWLAYLVLKVRARKWQQQHYFRSRDVQAPITRGGFRFPHTHHINGSWITLSGDEDEIASMISPRAVPACFSP